MGYFGLMEDADKILHFIQNDTLFCLWDHTLQADNEFTINLLELESLNWLFRFCGGC